MKDRLSKFLVTLVLCPLLFILMLVLAVLMFVLPIAVLINPDIVKFKEES